MKKTILLSLLLFFQVTNAQERVNDPVAEIISKSIKITSANGYQKNLTTGEWVENKNCIYDKKCESWWVDHVPNFIYIQFWKIVFNDKNYYALISEQKTGWYEYPAIEQDWKTGKVTKWMVFNPDEYEAFKDGLIKNVGKESIFKSDMSGQLTNQFSSLGGEYLYTEQNILKLISKSINKAEKYLAGVYIFLPVSLNNNSKNVIRFREIDSYVLQYKTNRFDEQYFEIPEADFNNVFKPILIEDSKK